MGIRDNIIKKGEEQMKKFEKPTIEVAEFAINDVITTSSNDGCGSYTGCPNELPELE